MTRDELVTAAQTVKNGAVASAMRSNLQLQFVVVVTDITGEWVGVSSSENTDRTEAMLQSALHGAERLQHELEES